MESAMKYQNDQSDGANASSSSGGNAWIVARKPVTKRAAFGLIAAVAVVGLGTWFVSKHWNAQANNPANAAAQATPASVAAVTQQDVVMWDEFSGRLEAIDRVEVRSRVAGAVLATPFREGSMVKQGDLLVKIDPAPYAAEVDRSEAQVAAAEARVALTKSDLERGEQLTGTRVITQREFDQRVNAKSEAEANLKAARAQLETNRLNLSYTDVRAPVSGRVGKLEITTGNLVAAGPGAPVLTTLVSVDPIYASFNADEQIVTRALRALDAQGDTHTQVDRIPVLMTSETSDGVPLQGKMQLIDNQVEARTGTVRVRAVFDNPSGRLIPGQFARLRMGAAKKEPALLVNERAIGTDQDKKFVLVIDSDSKAQYREITLGNSVEGLRAVTKGLQAGERIVVNGIQRVRPGALVAPQMVSMDPRASANAVAGFDNEVARR
jgi:multidrug efflux system membrane fusion protein